MQEQQLRPVHQIAKVAQRLEDALEVDGRQVTFQGLKLATSFKRLKTEMMPLEIIHVCGLMLLNRNRPKKKCNLLVIRRQLLPLRQLLLCQQVQDIKIVRTCGLFVFKNLVRLLNKLF